MKEIIGSATAVVPAPAQECFDLFSAVDRYGEWCGELVRELEVVDWGPDKQPTRVRVLLDLKRSPLMMALELTVAVHREALRTVHITRVKNEPSDPERLELVWRVDPDGSRSGTRLDLALQAVASFVPSFVPVGGIGDRIATKLVERATEALGRAGSRGEIHP